MDRDRDAGRGEQEPEVRRLLQRLFRTQKLAVLATGSEAGPYCCLVAVAASSDLGELFFVTPRPTRKYRNILADPRVCLLMDSRSNSEADFEHAVAVTVLGSAAEADTEQARGMLARYVERHPHLAEFASSPQCALVRVQVDRYVIVQHFQRVSELKPGPGSRG